MVSFKWDCFVCIVWGKKNHQKQEGEIKYSGVYSICNGLSLHYAGFLLMMVLISWFVTIFAKWNEGMELSQCLHKIILVKTADLNVGELFIDFKSPPASYLKILADL